LRAHTYTHIQGTGGWTGSYDALGKPWQHPLMGGTKTGEPKALGVATVEPGAPFATEREGSHIERQVRDPEANSRLFPWPPFDRELCGPPALPPAHSCMHMPKNARDYANECEGAWQALPRTQKQLSPVMPRQLGKISSSMPIGVLTPLTRSRSPPTRSGQGSRKGSRGGGTGPTGTGEAGGGEKKQSTSPEGAGFLYRNDVKDLGRRWESGDGSTGKLVRTWGGRDGIKAGERELIATGAPHQGAIAMTLTRRLNSHQGYSRPAHAVSMRIPAASRQPQ